MSSGVDTNLNENESSLLKVEINRQHTQIEESERPWTRCEDQQNFRIFNRELETSQILSSHEQKQGSTCKGLDLNSQASINRLKSLASKQSYYFKKDLDVDVLKKVNMPGFNPSRLTMAEQHKLQHLLEEKTYL